MSAWIYTDADNTLWDTDAVFAQAQLALLDAAERIAGKQATTTERLAFVRQFDQAIAVRHHQGLRYPPALLVRALSSGVSGSSAEAAAQRALAEGVVATDEEAAGLASYSTTLSSVPSILPGVRRGLELALENQIPIYVISEGPLELVRARLRALDLERLTSGALSAKKTPELYIRLKQRAAPHRAVMIGDQPDRDIRFARESGMHALLVEGRFRPHWIRSADTTYADAVVQDFFEAVKWVKDTEKNSPD